MAQFTHPRPWELEGWYGNAEAGEPIQYHRPAMIGKNRESEIEFYDLAIAMLMWNNTEELRRIFRCLLNNEKFAEKA